MRALADQSGKIMAYLDNLVILKKEQDFVTGLKLGDWVYGHEGKVIGWVFHDLLYNKKGEIVARLLFNKGHKVISENFAELNRQAWSIASKVHDHSGPWIQPSTNWSAQSLNEML